MYSTICAISAAGSRTCHLCGSATHIVGQCPKLKSLVADPVKAKTVLAAIQRGLPNGGGQTGFGSPDRPIFPRSSTPPVNNRRDTRPVRSLQDDDTDTDVTVSQLTDGEDSPDFP